MGVIHKFKCDGCDLEIEQKQELHPFGWNYAWTRLNYWDSYSYLVCEKCSKEMRKFTFFKALLYKIGALK